MITRAWQFIKDVFAKSGDVSDIPIEQSLANPNYASYTNGIPSICSDDKNAGGMSPHRNDFNALFKLSTGNLRQIQAGLFPTFDVNMATAPQTGYSKGAVLWYDKGDGTGYWVTSSKDNNIDNFVTTPSFIGTSWFISDSPTLASKANVIGDNITNKRGFLGNLGIETNSEYWNYYSGNEGTTTIDDSGKRLPSTMVLFRSLNLGLFSFRWTMSGNGRFTILTPPDSISLYSAGINAAITFDINTPKSYMQTNHIGFVDGAREGGNGKIGLYVAERSRLAPNTQYFDYTAMGIFRLTPNA